MNFCRMRDLSAQHSTDNQRLSKENESFKQQVEEVSKKNDKLTHEMQLYDVQMGELKEQVSTVESFQQSGMNYQLSLLFRWKNIRWG